MNALHHNCSHGNEQNYCIEQGYVDNGIDTDCLYDALEYSYDNETEHNQYTI